MMPQQYAKRRPDQTCWNPDRETVITTEALHDNVGYTPYEGRTITGWPEVVISRGRVVVTDGRLDAERGSGRYLRRASPAIMKQLGAPVPGRPHGHVLKALAGLD